MTLTVHIHSFGFRVSGIPADPTDHGGGFVFDCRGLPNPGREAQYHSLTGLDAAVQQYFSQYPEVQRFSDTALVLVKQTIQSYQKQNFTNLMVSFGCTGGQHRSVYQAELLRQHLISLAGVLVKLTHVEQPRWPQSI